MDERLERMLAPIRRDIAATGGPEPIIAEHDGGDPGFHRVWFLGVDGDGAGIGIWLAGAESAAEQSARLASDVHDWAVEELWSRGEPTNWPVCPAHPATHPLQPERRADRVVWVCPQDRTEIAVVGELHPPSRS